MIEANTFISQISNMTRGKASNILNIASYHLPDNIHAYYGVLSGICQQYSIPDTNLHVHPTNFHNQRKHDDYIFDIINSPNIDGLVFPIIGSRPKYVGRVSKISVAGVCTTYKLEISRG